jgi:Mg-chelatase subunit ChlD
MVAEKEKNKMNSNNSIVPGSLSAIATQSGNSIAETFIGADVVILVDTSGSMEARDSRGGLSRYDVACQELAQLQANLPGKIAVVSFANFPMFCPGGRPVNLGGSTALDKALEFTKIADVPGMRFIIISDGEPDSQERAMRQAVKYTNRIDTIFVGPEDRPAGRDFLNRLAAASGGQGITMDRAKELAAGVQYLLAAG